MYSFGNKMSIGEMSMQPIGGDELGPGFGDDVDDSAINDATYDVDGVSDQMALAIDTDPYAIGQNLGLMGDGSDDGSMSNVDDSPTDYDSFLDDGSDSGDGGLGGYSGGVVAPAAPAAPWTLGVVPVPGALPSSPSAVANVSRLAGLHVGIAPPPSFWSRLRNLHLGVRRPPAPAAPVPSAQAGRMGHLQLGVRPAAPKHLPGQAAHPAGVVSRTIPFNIPKGTFGP